MAARQKVAIYRSFFEKCRELLTPEGCMTLQTIAYGDPDDMTPTGSLIHDIFPDSETASAAGDYRSREWALSRSSVCATTEPTTDALASYGRRRQRAAGEAEALVGREQTCRRAPARRLGILVSSAALRLRMKRCQLRQSDARVSDMKADDAKGVGQERRFYFTKHIWVPQEPLERLNPRMSDTILRNMPKLPLGGNLRAQGFPRQAELNKSQ